MTLSQSDVCRCLSCHLLSELPFDKSYGQTGIDTKGDNVEEPDPWTVHEEDLRGKVIDIIPTVGIFLIEPVRYSLVAVIIITAVSLLKDITSETKKATKKSEPEEK